MVKTFKILYYIIATLQYIIIELYCQPYFIIVTLLYNNTPECLLTIAKYPFAQPSSWLLSPASDSHCSTLNFYEVNFKIPQMSEIMQFSSVCDLFHLTHWPPVPSMLLQWQDFTLLWMCMNSIPLCIYVMFSFSIYQLIDT
jgi:hypothetical protein